MNCPSAQAHLTVMDDNHQQIVLNHPAQRIISLSPHLTECLAAAGASEKIIAVDTASDYPKFVSQLPKVSDYRNINIEAILALHPDLVVAWDYGQNHQQLKQLESFGIVVYHSHPNHLSSIAKTIEYLGILAGTEKLARQKAGYFLQQLKQLKVSKKINKFHSSKKNHPIIFYQIWSEPLMTINNNAITEEVIELCGGFNPFAKTKGSVVTVTLENVIAANPDIIIAPKRTWAFWKQWPMLSAVKQQHLYTIPPEELSRMSPRILRGAKKLCKIVASVSGNISSPSPPTPLPPGERGEKRYTLTLGNGEKNGIHLS